MSNQLPAHYVQLVWEAAHKSFWRRQALHSFLRSSGISQSFLATWTPEESKRDFLNRLFPKLESTPSGIARINALADALLEQKSFPDLDGWDDTRLKKQEAQKAVSALSEYRSEQVSKAAKERSRRKAREHAKKTRDQLLKKQKDLATLNESLDALTSLQGTAEGGYAFERWFYDLVAYFELQHKRPYKTGGRQIDGSITAGDTTYLVELKFTSSQIGAPSVAIFRRKVETKADNTMGIMSSMSGYSSHAIDSASGDRSPILLMDYHHLYAVLGGVLTLEELIGRTRRNASQTGRAFVRLDELR